MENQDDINRKLVEAGKDLPFRVPRNYFIDFPARMEALIEGEEEKKKGVKLRLFDYLKPALVIAAAFASVFLLVYWPIKLVTNPALLSSSQARESEQIINLVEHVDDHTFLSLLESENKSEPLDDEILERYISANYSDLDILMETHK